MLLPNGRDTFRVMSRSAVNGTHGLDSRLLVIGCRDDEAELVPESDGGV
jgi:hypothetical protein